MVLKIHQKRHIQLPLALLLGIMFGFLLQKGGVTRYDVIIGQLLLKDWTVVKIMVSAITVGTLGIHFMKNLGWVRLQPKPGSIGQTVIGGLIFGVGFALLGYCPGTIAGAVGQGSLDAVFGGLFGIITGAWLFSVVYPFVNRRIYPLGNFKDKCLPEILNVNHWIVVIPASLILLGFLIVIEVNGL